MNGKRVFQNVISLGQLQVVSADSIDAHIVRGAHAHHDNRFAAARAHEDVSISAVRDTAREGLSRDASDPAQAESTRFKAMPRRCPQFALCYFARFQNMQIQVYAKPHADPRHNTVDSEKGHQKKVVKHMIFLNARLNREVHIEELYCFHYKSTPDELPKSAGWNYFDIQTDYQRMNVPNEYWVLCTANKDYELCDTYPSEIYVPARASTAVLLGSASFRSRGRLPALAYLHQNKAAIARCSQPLSGFSARCMEDEQMLDLIRRANPNCGYMYVVDTRPRINAMVNRAAGKGYENEAFYENIKFQFMGIGNIHVMRKSLQKLVETCEQTSPTMSSFLSGLESSGWLKHIKSILDTSWWIAGAVDSGVSVCVHCSDGWDRTAQVVSLASVLLDPHYRTINGFQEEGQENLAGSATDLEQARGLKTLEQHRLCNRKRDQY
ncbi:Myotubularin-related protein 8 [Eumeta japonica]|uniref:Myotubularin-related protein 8 n=1 Tax=Eumeta variegata TaxID=151549 RepID=A0A4C1Z203_EUMVA|nr:Myotubularin-related protein 8 [Eumeta japonica]